MKSFIEFQKEEVELDEATVGAHQQGWHDAYHTGKPPHQHHTIIYKDKEQRKEYLEGHKEGILARKSDMKEELELEEATVKTQKYSWGTMKTVHHGSDFSIPLHPEHHQEIAKLKDQQEHKFKDETGHHWTAKRSGDDVHFKGANGGNSTTVKHSTMSEEVELDEEHLIHVSDGSKYGDEPSKKDADHVMSGVKTHNGEFDSHTDKGAVFKFKSHSDASNFKRHVDKCPGKTCYADHTESTEFKEEQLDELSKKTLGAYTRQAAVSLAVGGMKMGRDVRPTAVIRDGEKTVTKRIKGINRATYKLTKEEVELDEEQLDELSPKTLGSYIKKAVKSSNDQAGKSVIRAMDSVSPDLNDLEKDKLMSKYSSHKKIQANRVNGISTAVNKLTKEEVELDEEQLDELSKDTLASYEKKSRVAAHKHALASELKGLAADPAGSYAHKMMADKRHAGWKVAVKKLHTEESDTPFEGPYKQSKGTVTDKSGAKHTPLSNVRSLARNAIEKMKQKIRMAHLSPEVKAEKLARNEELVGGQKKLDIDKDGKIEKSDLEVLRTKKLKEDVTTATQKLKAALDRHTEHAVAANRAGDHEAVKVHQEYANKIKTKLGKLAKNEEVEIDESENPFKNLPGKFTHILNKDVRGDHGIINMGTVLRHTGGDRYEVRAGKSKGKTVEIHKDHVNVNEEVEIDEGHQIVATTKAGETFKSGIHPTKEKALSQYYKMSKSGNYKKIATVKTEEVEIDEEQIEERNKQNAIMRKTMDASRGAKFKARNNTPDAEPQHKTAQAHNKAIGRAIRQMSNEEVEIDEASMTDAEMAKREKIVKGMKKSFKDFTAKYGDRAKEVMYATATKKAMEEEVEEELEEDMDEGAVHKESYESHLANLHKVHQKSGNLEAAIKKVPTKHLQQIHYNNAERADHSVHPITKSAEKELKSRNVPLIEEDMDEGVTTRNGAVTVHKGTYGTSYQPNDDEDDEDTPEKKEPAVKRGRGRPAGAGSGAKPKGSSAGKSYGGVAIHSLRLPNNNK